MAARKRQIGYAVVGLGHIVQHVVLPAFENATKNSKLVALVSGDADKRAELGAKYAVPTFDYDQLEQCLDLPDVDAVYIGLPNDQHADFAERCAKKGVHVLCEKPMALTSNECERMIRAADEADVKLMIAYRLHLERSNLFVIEKLKSGDLGEPRYFNSAFSYQVKEENIRTSQERGGGPQWDIGPYCINAARYTFRAEPTEVVAYAASSNDPRFKETPEMLTVLMRYPEDRLAQFVVSFGAATEGFYEVVCTKGSVCIENAYEYEGPRLVRWAIGDEEKKKRFRPNDQFGPELIYFSDCVLKDREPEMNGYEGLADVRIIEAINESVIHGRPVKLEPFEKRTRPEPFMAFNEPMVKTEELVGAGAPHQE